MVLHGVPYQILLAGGDSKVDPRAKIVCTSPEKLLEKSLMSSITKLSWSAVSIDEPHLALMWGISKTKYSKPFREAFAQLNSLNSLKVCFELHSATLENLESLYKLLGRKSSVWAKQLEVPERRNLTYFLFQGGEAPHHILQLPSVKQTLHANAVGQNGITLIFVQRISDGADIQLALLDYCDRNKLIRSVGEKPVAFLHSTLSEEVKGRILDDAMGLKIKILITTSAGGTGINLKVNQFIGWGLDCEPSGIVQSQGRTARSQLGEEGIVIWCHNSKLHGQRISSGSRVRELLKSRCLRKTMNKWFTHGESSDPVLEPAEPETCCSECMKDCIDSNNCFTCHTKISTFKPIKEFDEKLLAHELTKFLTSLQMNEKTPEMTPHYRESSIGSIIKKRKKYLISFFQLRK